MAVKMYNILLAALVFAGVVMPLSHAQRSGLVSNLLNVTGIVPCSIGSSINVSTSNVFPNANVQLRCAGNMIGSGTTNSIGAFQIVGSLLGDLSGLLGLCNVVIMTPLISCNVSLPSTGNLVAGVNTVGTILGGVTDLVPGLFTFIQNLSP